MKVIKLEIEFTNSIFKQLFKTTLFFVYFMKIVKSTVVKIVIGKIIIITIFSYIKNKIKFI
jgi:hypothetical protein